jgi:phosphohistidine phosphatase SixA
MKSRHQTRPSTWLARLGALAASCMLLALPGMAGTGGPAGSAPQGDVPVTTVYLVRHAEKAAAPPEDPPLSEAGASRSQALSRILGKAGIKAVYTSQFLRTKLTAEPLAKQFGVTSTVVALKSSASNPREVSEQSIREVVDKVYAKPGESVLIVGHSNSVPEVIRMLGGDAVPTIDEKEFDDLFVVTVYAKGKAKVAHLKY